VYKGKERIFTSYVLTRLKVYSSSLTDHPGHYQFAPYSAILEKADPPCRSKQHNQFQLQIQKQARNLIVRQEHFAVQRLSSAPRQSKFISLSSLPLEPTTPLFLMYSVPSPERDACQVATTTCEVNDTSRLLGLSPYHIKQRQETPRRDVL